MHVHEPRLGQNIHVIHSFQTGCRHLLEFFRRSQATSVSLLGLEIFPEEELSDALRLFTQSEIGVLLRSVGEGNDWEGKPFSSSLRTSWDPLRPHGTLWDLNHSLEGFLVDGSFPHVALLEQELSPCP